MNGFYNTKMQLNDTMDIDKKNFTDIYLNPSICARYCPIYRNINRYHREMLEIDQRPRSFHDEPKEKRPLLHDLGVSILLYFQDTARRVFVCCSNCLCLKRLQFPYILI